MSSALQLLCQYDTDDDCDVQQDHSSVRISPQIQSDKVILQTVQHMLSKIVNKVTKICDQDRGCHYVSYRSTCNQDEINFSSSSSSLSDSDEDQDDITTLQEILDEDCDEGSGLPPRTPGELGLEDLPPIQQLTIKAPVEELCHLGRIASMIDCLVSVQSFKGQSALDLDSVLFLKDGSPLGSVFEVFGPVKEPRYLVRFNSRKEIEERSITVDAPVYCAPALGAPITSFVFTTDLMKMKGSDASWKHNNEPPEELREFSDDEEERMCKLKSKGKRKAGGGTPSARRPTNYASPSTLRAPPNTPANLNRWSIPRLHGLP